MAKYLSAILLSFLTLNVFPQAVIKGRSAPGYVSIKEDASGTIAMGPAITGRSSSGYVNILPEIIIKPPQLQADNISFVDTDGNNYLNANENSRIIFVLKNTGEGPALNMEVRIIEKNRAPGLTYQSKTIGTLQPGEIRSIEIPVSGNENTTNSTASFSITINEANKFGIDLPPVILETRALVVPMVTISEIDYGGIRAIKGKPFDVRVVVRNAGPGMAENVTITLPLGENVINLNNNNREIIGNLASGEAREIKYNLITNKDYNFSKVNLSFVVSEKYGKYADNGRSSTAIPIDQPLTAENPVVIRGEEKAVAQNRPASTAVAGTSPAAFTSDVDRDIPIVKSKSQNKVALIIGNEDYSKAYNAESNVDFAARDAEVFSEYTKKILGIEEKYVLLSLNATYMVMKSQVQRAIDIAKVIGSQAEIIFYYAGHGFPDQSTRIPYLIPVDVSASNLTSAIKLADIYAQLGSSGAGRITVFLDACFSGGGRDMGPVNARSVRMVPNTEEGMVTGNMVVFTASTGEQTAQALNKQQHGLFTYYLLKKLKETSGNVTYGELFDYINKNVQLDALTENNKPQVPVILTGDVAGDKWRSWKIR